MSLLKVLERFAKVTLELLFAPSKFFDRGRLEGGIQLPLLYAICTHWIASTATFGWEGLISRAMKTGLGDLWLILNDAFRGAYELGHPGRNSSPLPDLVAQLENQFFTWFWGASSVLLSPFKTLFLLGWAALFLFVASRLLIFPNPSRPVTFQGSLRLACFASTTVLWKVVPVMGSLISEIMLLLTTVIAVQKSYQIGRIRAFAVAFFPQLLLVGAILTVILGFLALLFRSLI